MNDKRPTDHTLVVICANTRFNENPLGAKPLAQALSKKCHVVYIDPPLSFVTAIKQPQLRKSFFGKKMTEVSSSLLRIIPVVFPGKDRFCIHNITSLILRFKIRQVIKKLNSGNNVDTMVIATAPHHKVFLKNTFNVYWMMDDYASQPGLTGIAPTLLESGQNYLSTTSNANVVVSDYLHSTLQKKGVQSSVIFNGANSDLFTFPAARINIPIEISSQLPEDFCLYVGGVNDRLDLSYLAEVALNKNVVIVGRVDPRADLESFDELCKSPNVTYLGVIDNDYVPALMNKATVGLVPYADTVFNRSSMPLKIPEYLLCGLPVVSTALDFVSAFSNDDVYGEKSPQDFANRVNEIMMDEPTPGQRAMRSSRISLEWSWDKKADDFLSLATTTQ